MKKGFTLLEVIIAISVLTVGVGGTFILINQTLKAASLANSKLVAAYLAQEGAEIVINFRDNNWLEQRTNSGLSWKDGLEEGEYEAGYNDTSLSSFQNRYLYIDSSDGFYDYSGDKQTKFKRKITIANGEGDEAEIKIIVTVEVFWQERGNEHKIEVVKNLYNWHGY